MATVSVRYIVYDVGEAIAFYMGNLGVTEVRKAEPRASKGGPRSSH